MVHRRTFCGVCPLGIAAVLGVLPILAALLYSYLMGSVLILSVRSVGSLRRTGQSQVKEGRLVRAVAGASVAEGVLHAMMHLLMSILSVVVTSLAYHYAIDVFGVSLHTGFLLLLLDLWASWVSLLGRLGLLRGPSAGIAVMILGMVAGVSSVIIRGITP